MTSARNDVLMLLKRSEPLAPSTVATRLALPYERTKKAMQRLARAGELERDTDGRYRVRDRDTAAPNGPRIRILRDAWEEPPPTPRWLERWLS